MPQSILKLPSEILLDICQRSDLKDINALARCCKYTYAAINPILYRLDARSFSPWALYWSCITGAPRTATLSIAAGSSVSQFCDPRLARSREPNWKQYGYSRPSALDIAIRSDNDELIELLKSHDAKITDWATLDIFIVKGQRQLFTEFLSHLPVSSQIGRRYGKSYLTERFRPIIQSNQKDMLTDFWGSIPKQDLSQSLRSLLGLAISTGLLDWIKIVFGLVSCTLPFDRSQEDLLQAWYQSAGLIIGDREAVFQYLDENYPIFSQTFHEEPQDWVLSLACRAGNGAVARRLLELGATMQYNALGRMHLSEAIISRNIAMVRLLMEHVDPQDLDGFLSFSQAILCAAWCGSVETLQLFLDHGQELPVTDGKPTLVHFAIDGGQFEMAQYLLSLGLEMPEDAASFFWLSNLERMPSVELLKLCLDNGARPSPRDKNNETPLIRIFKWISKYNPPFTSTSLSNPFISTSKEIEKWSESDFDVCLNMIKLLVSRGASFEEVTVLPQYLGYALGVTNTQMREYLLQQPLILNAREAANPYMLGIACRRCDVELARQMLDHNNVSATEGSLLQGYYRCPLELACVEEEAEYIQDRPKLLQLLIEHGGGEDGCRERAVAFLCRSKSIIDIPSMRVLLGVDNFNASAVCGTEPDDTLLHLACLSKNPIYVQILLEAGADVDAEDDLGYSPMDIALGAYSSSGPDANEVAIIKLLLAYGSYFQYEDLTEKHLQLIPELRELVEDYEE